MLQDLRFAFRIVVKERWYTIVAVVALALGIGVNATGFTVVNAAFLRGPAFKDSGRLYFLSWQSRTNRNVPFSHPELLDLRNQSTAFSGIAAYQTDRLNISGDQVMPEQAEGAWLTANAFDVLQQQPLIGRSFAPGEDAKGAQPVVILSYKLWQRRYGGNPGVVGTAVRLNGQPATIVGVMPDQMNFPINSEIWAALIPGPASEQRTTRNLSAFGRLRDGVTVRQAEAEMNGIAQQLASAYPASNADLTRGLLETITQRFIGGAARVVFPLITVAAGFVLLIACANVANLLLSRSEYRSREIAMRMTLGASRYRVIRQLLLESIVLSAIGGAAGVVLAYTGAHAIDASINDPGKPYWIVFSVDHVVLAYIVASCVVTGILFGLAPALHISKGNMNEVLKQSGRGMAGSRTHWFSNTMVVLQLSLTIVLLVGAGLMIRSFLNLYTVALGFPTNNLTAMRLQLPANKYATPESRQAFFDQLTPRLSAIPGLQGIAVSTSVPGFGSRFGSFEIDGRPARGPGDNGPSAAIVTISPNLFDVLGVTLRRGRSFNEKDGTPGAEALIINERMATMFFPGEDPIGKRLRLGGPDSRWLTIIGISPSIPHASLRNSEVAPAVYAPLRQSPPASFSVLTRTTLLPSSLMSAVRREVQMVDQDQPVFTIQTVDQMLEQDRFGARLSGGLFGIFAGIALILSAVGLYAVMAYQVTQRTQEIGVRVALGAQNGQISWLILKRGLVQLAIGLGLGLAGAFAVSRLLERALFRVTPADPATFLTITFVLTAVALAACVIPARRATRVDPLAAIRME